MQAEATRETLALASLKRQATSEAAVVGLLKQALDLAKAGPLPPPGQGQVVDLKA